MNENKTHSKEDKPKKTRSSKQKTDIWLGVGATIVTIGGFIIKLISGRDNGGKQAPQNHNNNAPTAT